MILMPVSDAIVHFVFFVNRDLLFKKTISLTTRIRSELSFHLSNRNGEFCSENNYLAKGNGLLLSLNYTINFEVVFMIKFFSFLINRRLKNI